MSEEDESSIETEVIKGKLVAAILNGGELSPEMAELFIQAYQKRVKIDKEVENKKGTEEGKVVSINLKSLAAQALSSGEPELLDAFRRVVVRFPLFMDSADGAIPSLRGEMKIIESGHDQAETAKRLEIFDSYTHTPTLAKTKLGKDRWDEKSEKYYADMVAIFDEFGRSTEVVNKMFEDFINLGKSDRVFVLVDLALKVKAADVMKEHVAVADLFINFDKEKIGSVIQNRMGALLDGEWGEGDPPLRELWALWDLATYTKLSINTTQLQEKIQYILENKLMSAGYFKAFLNFASTRAEERTVHSHLLQRSVDGLGVTIDYNEKVEENRRRCEKSTDK